MRRGLMANIMLGVVIGMGLVNFSAQFFIEGYQPDPVITAAFLTIAGLILGVKGIGQNNAENSEQDKKEDSK